MARIVSSMMKSIFIFIVLFLSCKLVSQNQELLVEAEEEFEEISRVHFFEANFSIYRPLDAFETKIEKKVLYGFSLGFLTQLQKGKPSFLGVEAFHMNLGSFSKNYIAIVGNEQIGLSGKVASNALGLNAIYRYYPPLKLSIVEPYVEGHLGLKFLYSYLSEAGAFTDDEPYDNFDFLTNDWVLTYGGSFGLQLHISNNYYLNLKSTYHFAVSGEYQKRLYENIETIDFPQEAFEQVQSSTNVVKMDIGLTVLF